MMWGVMIIMMVILLLVTLSIPVDHEAIDGGVVYDDYVHGLVTASVALWLRRPPRDRKTRGSNPACGGIFPGRVIPVT